AGLPHRLERCEMHNGVELSRGEQPPDGVAVPQVHLLERHGRADDLLQAPEHAGRAVAQVVRHDKIVPAPGQHHAGVASDVTGTAKDKDAHGELPPAWPPIITHRRPDGAAPCDRCGCPCALPETSIKKGGREWVCPDSFLRW